jgi:hypothetical protein
MLKPQYKPQVEPDSERTFLQLRNMTGVMQKENTAINTAVVPDGDYRLFIKFRVNEQTLATRRNG